MDNSRAPTSAGDEQKNRMTSNHPHANQYAYPESTYHQKPPSFNHKQVNISLVDGEQSKVNKKKKAANATGKTDNQQAEWRESIPIKLEHFLFNFKENKANLPMDQSAIAERIIGEGLLSNHKLKTSFFDQKNQTTSGSEKTRESSKSSNEESKDAVRKVFGSLLQFSGNDHDEVEPDQEENNSDESFDNERSKNFNFFLSDDRAIEKADQVKGTNEQSENPRVMFIERLMGLHFGLQPRFGASESQSIHKTISSIDENATGDDDRKSSKSEPEVNVLVNGKRISNSNKLKESRAQQLENTIAPFLFRYAAAAMLSRVLANAQQQAYLQQAQQQRLREMNEKFNSPYNRGYRMMMREPVETASSFMYGREPMYGRPIHMNGQSAHYKQQTSRMAMSPFQPASGQFYSSDRGYSRGPLISNDEAESQQIHPIILMLNVPLRDQTPHLLGATASQPQPPQQPSQQQPSIAQPFAHPIIESTMQQSIFMPRQNPFFKSHSQTPMTREPAFSSSFGHHKNYNNFHQTPALPVPSQHPNAARVANNEYTAHHQHPYSNIMHVSANRASVPPSQRYNARTVTNTIELPIEIHHQVSPSVSPMSAVSEHQSAHIIVQPQIETQSQPNEPSDQTNENEHHMVVFYSDSDNGQPEETTENQPQLPQAQSPPQQQVAFMKESKQINSDLEKAGKEISKMLLLHFVNPNGSQAQSSRENANTAEQQTVSGPNEKTFLVGQLEQQEKASNNPISKLDEDSTSNNDQMNREEIAEKEITVAVNGPNESEPTSLAQFAQVIRHQMHVIDQQQPNQQESQPMRPTEQQSSITSGLSVQQSTAMPPSTQMLTFNMPKESNKENTQIENSNKDTERAQESVVAPTFMLAQDNEEN